ncbi:hypothetical protein VP1G_10614 [Cytospora mali]|uniref:Uncharacterized protein n=1 Tax=Cytospora mali TaxID=578113 RepID=A0A194UQY8_CYTMA|nr:hypothetical protein VP1G_10614 [Valsa mali var. pyri (nom. inval.)]
MKVVLGKTDWRGEVAWKETNAPWLTNHLTPETQSGSTTANTANLNHDFPTPSAKLPTPFFDKKPSTLTPRTPKTLQASIILESLSAVIRTHALMSQLDPYTVDWRDSSGDVCASQTSENELIVKQSIPTVRVGKDAAMPRSPTDLQP